MFVAFYTGTSKGWPGLVDVAIRKVLHGDYSHCELVFESGDGADHLMPDNTCSPSATGAHWCASSSMMDRMPTWSKRAGELGGVRFKRIVLKWDHWVMVKVKTDPIKVAQWFVANEGMRYAIKGTIAHAFPFIRHTDGTANCTHATASALGYKQAERFNPCNLYVTLEHASNAVYQTVKV